jgi:surface antigen
MRIPIKKTILTITIITVVAIIAYLLFTKSSLLQTHTVGEKIDSFNGVAIYYNGNVGNVEGRNIVDGYNVGLKFQCVEFVKRYYLEALDHKMPDSYGHAKSFFNSKIKDGESNKQRNLTQYKNGSRSKPKVHDLLVFNKTTFNPYGHVAIISEVTDTSIEIIQQNPGKLAKSRVTYKLSKQKNLWRIEHNTILGWLRK